MDYSLKIGGAAGQGVQTVADSLSRVFLRQGYFVFTTKDYQSRVRGGHTFTQIRIAGNPLSAMRERVDLLVCLNQETFDRHATEVQEGFILGALEKNQELSATVIPVDFKKIAQDLGNQIYANMVAVGAVLGLLGLEISSMEKLIHKYFDKKGKDVVESNLSALVAGKSVVESSGHPPVFKEVRKDDDNKNILINGNDAIGLGAVLAGCSFYSAYPMTPSSGVLNFMASRSREYGIVVEQAEDEIAALNMAIGASYAGARAMTGTSGGGFCLMVEGLGLAAMTETPIVVLNGQRPGPSTGLPTRTSQGDLEFVIHASHDEFPRFVLAPREPEDALNTVIRAFNLAERFQVPVIILSDQYLADSEWTYAEIAFNESADPPAFAEALDDYKRYRISKNGVSPRAVPGTGPGLVIADSDEHDQTGHITEDLSVRVEMQEKRMRKFDDMRNWVRSPLKKEGEDLTLVGWGSTYGILLEAREHLMNQGIHAGLYHFTDVFPFPSDIRETFEALPNPVIVEGNYLGQLARLLERETGLRFPRRVNTYNGRPMLVEELLHRLEEVTK